MNHIKRANMLSIARLVQTMLVASVFAATSIQAAQSTTEEDCNNGFPTSAVADYVLGCMAANGNTFEALHQCSCSIDFIKTKLSYEEYERAQTVLRAQLDQGQRGTFYREAKWGKAVVEKLEKTQAESTLRCF